MSCIYGGIAAEDVYTVQVRFPLTGMRTESSSTKQKDGSLENFVISKDDVLSFSNISTDELSHVGWRLVVKHDSGSRTSKESPETELISAACFKDQLFILSEDNIKNGNSIFYCQLRKETNAPILDKMLDLHVDGDIKGIASTDSLLLLHTGKNSHNTDHFWLSGSFCFLDIEGLSYKQLSNNIPDTFF